MKKVLERHMKNMHDSYSQKEKGQKRKNIVKKPEMRKRMRKSFEATYSCTLCNTDFKARTSFESHIKNARCLITKRKK